MNKLDNEQSTHVEKDLIDLTIEKTLPPTNVVHSYDVCTMMYALLVQERRDVFWRTSCHIVEKLWSLWRKVIIIPKNGLNKMKIMSMIFLTSGKIKGCHLQNIFPRMLHKVDVQ